MLNRGALSVNFMRREHQGNLSILELLMADSLPRLISARVQSRDFLFGLPTIQSFTVESRAQPRGPLVLNPELQDIASTRLGYWSSTKALTNGEAIDARDLKLLRERAETPHLFMS